MPFDNVDVGKPYLGDAGSLKSILMLLWSAMGITHILGKDL